MAEDDNTLQTGNAPSHNRSDQERFSGTVEFPERSGNKVFHWEVTDFRANISPPEDVSDLNDQERAKLFNSIVANVIKRSVHPDGSRSAAAAITESGQIFVSNNTQRQHEFHKDCAEINLINALTQLIGPKDRINEMYLSIGWEQGQVLCPCGKCMDTLSKASTKDASLTILPVNKGDLDIKLNSTANYIADLAPGETWQTTVSHFMPHSIVPLSLKERVLGEEGWKVLTGNNPLVINPLEKNEIERIQHAKLQRLSPGEQHIRKIMDRAAVNAAMRSINGEPELDVDHSPEAINQFMVERITRAYHARPPAKLPGQREAEMVRCVVVRLADGSFHSATEIEGSHEKAVPYAEITAVAATRTVAQPITDAWVMQMNRQNIAQAVMPTSSKEGLERLYKRRAQPEDNATDNEGKPIKDSLNLHYIPFNNGKLTHAEASEITRHFPVEKLFISQWKGAREYWQSKEKETSKGNTPGRH